jgi:hypothetical protein
MLHVQNFNDLIHISVFFLLAGSITPAKDGAESQRFSDRGGWEMNVLLLCITRMTLKCVASRHTVDCDIASNNPHRNSIRENIKERGFSSASGSLHKAVRSDFNSK